MTHSPSGSSEAQSIEAPRQAEDKKVVPDEPPNGGLAWLTVFACFLLFIVTWGPTIAFGLFQAYYEPRLPGYSPSDISWVGTVDAFFLITTGVVAGPLFDHGYLRELMVAGCFMAVFGMMMLSLATEYYQILLSLGFCFGIGSGLVYVPALAFINVYFTTRRAIAMGLVTAGASIGGLLFPIIFLQLQPRIGFPWTIRVFGFLILFCAAVALPLLFIGRRPPKPAKIRRLVDWSALRDKIFLADGAANFLIFLAYFIPFFYVPSFSSLALGSSTHTAFYQLATMNGASAVGRLGSSFLSARYGAVNLLLASVSSAAVLLFGWLGIQSNAALWVWAVLFGLLSGVLISSNPVVMAHPVISPSPAVVGMRMGMQWVFSGLGVLVGAPIGGALLAGATAAQDGLDAQQQRELARRHFQRLQGFNAAAMTVGLALLLVPVVAIWRYKAPART